MSFTSLYFGNQQEARLGPLPIPDTLSLALTLAEPLRFTDMTISNRTAGALQVSVWIVPAGDLASNDNALIQGVNLPPNDVVTYNNLNIPLNQQDQIWFSASAAGLNFFGTLTRRNR